MTEYYRYLDDETEVPCSLDDMFKHEPEWAISRFRFMESEAIKATEKRIELEGFKAVAITLQVQVTNLEAENLLSITAMSRANDCIKGLTAEITRLKGDHVRCPKCDHTYILETGRKST